MSPCRPAPTRPVHRRHSGPNPHENAAAAPGVVPRQLEFHQNTNIINSLQKSGVQVGLEIERIARNLDVDWASGAGRHIVNRRVDDGARPAGVVGPDVPFFCLLLKKASKDAGVMGFESAPRRTWL